MDEERQALIKEQVLDEIGSQMLKTLLNNDNVPRSIKESWYWIFSDDNVLGFTDEEAYISKMMSFDILKIDTLNAIPYKEYDFNLEREFNIARLIYETKLDRAKGFKDAGRINERRTQASQFSENRSISNDESASGGGVLGRLFGRKR